MAIESAAERQAMRRAAHRYASLLQRRIYDELVAAFMAGRSSPEDVLSAARLALQKARPDDIAI